jgi:hypothetical protein
MIEVLNQIYYFLSCAYFNNFSRVILKRQPQAGLPIIVSFNRIPISLGIIILLPFKLYKALTNNIVVVINDKTAIKDVIVCIPEVPVPHDFCLKGSTYIISFD